MKKYTYYVNSNGRRIKILVLRPTKHARASALTAGVLWVHGGGFAVGMPEMVYITRARALVEKFGVTVASPAYTLSWKRPYPAAIEDCYSSLLWFKAHAWELGFNPERIIVGGESAGGGLCAALCMLARDRGEVDIKYHFPSIRCSTTAIRPPAVTTTRGYGIRAGTTPHGSCICAGFTERMQSRHMPRLHVKLIM